MFLLGVVRVEAWGYRWGYSKAYIELMTIDTTITDFGKKTGDRNHVDEDALAEAREAYRKMKEEKERKKAQQVKI